MCRLSTLLFVTLDDFSYIIRCDPFYLSVRLLSGFFLLPAVCFYSILFGLRRCVVLFSTARFACPNSIASLHFVLPGSMAVCHTTDRLLCVCIMIILVHAYYGVLVPVDFCRPVAQQRYLSSDKYDIWFSICASLGTLIQNISF